MHLKEGILPVEQAITWGTAALPFLIGGWHRLRKLYKADRTTLPLVALLGAAVFIISLLPIPVPWTGTCSHMCGTPLAAILLGPWLGTLLGAITLVFQALLFGHGGISTWGANVFSMAVVGSFSAWLLYHLLLRLRVPWAVAIALAAVVGDLATYATTAIQLSWAIAAQEAFPKTLTMVTAMFLPIQGPLAVLEGFITAGVVQAMYVRRPDLFQRDTQSQLRTTPVMPILGLLLCLCVLPLAAQAGAPGGFGGMDEAVFSKVAEDAGRPGRAPLIDLGQGDLPLFMFTLGGFVAGVVVGRVSTLLFAKPSSSGPSIHASSPTEPHA